LCESTISPDVAQSVVVQAGAGDAILLKKLLSATQVRSRCNVAFAFRSLYRSRPGRARVLLVIVEDRPDPLGVDE
jgi:hypothetical protein